MKLALLLIVAPNMHTDRVLVDDDHFETQTGFWFNPETQALRFAELRQIRYVSISGTRSTSHQLHCITKTGEFVVVPVGDLAKSVLPEILKRAIAKNVPVFAPQSMLPEHHER